MATGGLGEGTAHIPGALGGPAGFGGSSSARFVNTGCALTVTVRELNAGPMQPIAHKLQLWVY